MAAVLYEWSEGRHDEDSGEDGETDEDVRRMIDNADYMSAFKLMDYMFVLIGNVGMGQKKDMFCWFTEQKPLWIH